jgi:hypothetical protein
MGPPPTPDTHYAIRHPVEDANGFNRILSGIKQASACTKGQVML